MAKCEILKTNFPKCANFGYAIGKRLDFTSLYLDKSLMRDYPVYDLSRKIGDYSSSGRFCEVVLNGDYSGLYILEEKIKLDKKRVVNSSNKFNTVTNPINIDELELPTTEQTNYVRDYLLNLDALTELPPNMGNFTDGYPSKIDVFSFYNLSLLKKYNILFFICL